MALTPAPLARKQVRIYLCGSVRKGRQDDRPTNEFWTAEDESFILQAIERDVEILNPSKTPISRRDYFVNFGCDIFLMQSSELVIADLRSEKGIGVGAELMYARQSGIPVIAWLPSGSHYRRDLSDVFGEDLRNWIHPFAYALTDYVEETLTDVCYRANSILSGKEPRLDRRKTIGAAIEQFSVRYPELTRR